MKRQNPERKESPTYIHTDISIGGDATFKKTISVQSHAEIKGNADISGSLNVGSDVIINGKVKISDQTTFDADVVFKKTISADAPYHNKATTKTRFLVVDELGIINGVLVVKEGLECAEISSKVADFIKIYIQENLSVNKLIECAGDAKLHGNVYVGKKLNVKGEMNVDDSVFIKKSLRACAPSVFEDELCVDKNFRAGGTSELYGEVNCKDRLIVKRDLIVGGGSIFCDQVVFRKKIKCETIVATGNETIYGDLLVKENAYAKNIKCEELNVINDMQVDGHLHVAENLNVVNELHCSELNAGCSNVLRDSAFQENLDVMGSMFIGAGVDAETLHCRDKITIKNGEIKSGGFFPTSHEAKNLNYFVIHECQFMQVGEVITVSGRIDLEAEKLDKRASIELSLPVPSLFKTTGNLSGTGVSHDGIENFACYANVISNRAMISYVPATIERTAFFFSFTYRVINEIIPANAE